MTYDVIGSIAIVNFEKGMKVFDRKKFAAKLLKERKNVKTVLEKSGKVTGRLRKLKTKFLAGDKATETVHVENTCRLKLDVEDCYFSPRLSNDRKEVAGMIKKGKNVLVMFAGVGPYPIVIAKLSKAKSVVSVELGRKCAKYGLENVRLNKLDNVEVIQGDVKKVVPRLRQKFEHIVMPRPQLRDNFLDSAFKVAKKGTEIYYHGFGRDVGKVLETIYKESKKAKKKIKVLKVKKAGEIAPFKFRWRVDFRVN